MATSIRDVMTPNPTTMAQEKTAADAARAMRDASIGDVVVLDGDRIYGIVTDRDIIVRVLAEGRDPERTPLAEICSRELTTVSPGDDIDTAIRLMREKAVRRLPVVERGRPVGILSIGDLAVDRDRQSVLGHISAAPPNL